VKIHTQFLFMRIVIACKLLLHRSNEFMPHGRGDFRQHDAVFYILRASWTKGRFGKEDVEIAVKEGQVERGHGVGGGSGCVSVRVVGGGGC
jgi:hypothetical protein